MRTRIIRRQRFSVHDRDGSSRTLFFKLEIGRLGRFFEPHTLPHFKGDDGFVEVLGPNTRIQILRQVEAGHPSRDATEAERRAIFAGRQIKDRR